MKKIEAGIGTQLPSDYKHFIGMYGTGGIDDFLWFLTSFVKDENVNFLSKTKVICDSYTESKQNHPEYYKYEVFPNKNGLLPWGYTDNGDILYWLTEGEPEKWFVVVYDSRSENYKYELTMTEFLSQII